MKIKLIDTYEFNYNESNQYLINLSAHKINDENILIDDLIIKAIEANGNTVEKQDDKTIRFTSEYGGLYYIDLNIEVPNTNYEIIEQNRIYIKIKTVKIGSLEKKDAEYIFTQKDSNLYLINDILKENFENTNNDYYLENNTKLNSDKQEDFILAKNKTLFIPRSNKNITLELNNDSLIIKGNLTTDGDLRTTLGIATQGFTNYKTASYIITDNNTRITVKEGGKLKSLGFIIGKGEIEVEKGGEVIEPFSIRDFKGGTVTAGTKSSEVMPICDFHVNNIEIKTKYKYGSKATNIVSVYIGSQEIWVETEMALIDTINNKNAFFLMQYNDSVIEKSFDIDTKVQKFEFFGSNMIGNLSFSKAGISFDTKNKVLVMPRNFHIIVNNGTLTLTESVLLMHGSILEVKKEGGLRLQKDKSLIAANNLEKSEKFNNLHLFYLSSDQELRYYKESFRDRGKNIPNTYNYDYFYGKDAEIIINGYFYNDKKSSGKIVGIIKKGKTGWIDNENIIKTNKEKNIGVINTKKIGELTTFDKGQAYLGLDISNSLCDEIKITGEIIII